MSYTNDTLDDHRPAEDRDIPKFHRRFTCDMGGGTEESFRLPKNVKVCDIENNTDQDLLVYVSSWDGNADDPSTNLHTAGTSSRIESVASGSSRPIAQNVEFNTLHFKAGAAATGLVTVRPGDGRENGLGDIETMAITAVS